MFKVKKSKSNHEADIKNHNNTTLDKNNKTYKAATDNHTDQLNENNEKFQARKNKKPVITPPIANGK